MMAHRVWLGRIGAAAWLLAALLILLQAGLPERAAFTGRMLPDGIRVAPEMGAVAPPFALPAMTGELINLLDLRGSPVILNFWATWCEPCRVEMPELQSLFQDYQARGLRLLAVNLGESRQPIECWMKEFNLTFDVLLDQEQQIAALYQLRGQPSTYIISPAGVITHIVFGATNRQALEAAIAPFFTG